jgi:CubicO group peptidase (beta-lactamase class C family)
MSDAQGWTAAGWEGVRDAFAANLAAGLEIGASFAAYHKGRKVVDLWGGVADPATERPWAEDTIVLVYSTTKGITAACVNRLAQEGRLDVDAPAAEYWPGFAQAGKADIPVKFLVSHQVGLPWVDTPLTPEEVFAWDPVITALENQEPVWAPGSQHGYHAVTYGFLAGELVRRITQRTIGTYLREEIAGPLGLDLWIGLPEEQEPRVAALVGGVDRMQLDASAATTDEEREQIAQMQAAIDAIVGPDTYLGKALTAPGGAFATPGIFDTRALRAAEVPAANMVTDARSVAKFYAAVIGDVTEDGTTHERILTPDQVAAATAAQTTGPDVVLLNLDLQFGLGYMVHGGIMVLGGPRSFGHFGMGGSMGWADPDAELSFGYAMNRLEMGTTGDPRSGTLVAACYAALG